MNLTKVIRWWATLSIALGAALFGQSAQAATFAVTPATGTYVVGQSVTVTVRINTASKSINAGEGVVDWTANTLQFVSVSSSGSIFKYWPLDPVVRGTSSVVFSGGLPSPGYAGSSGTILRVSFKAKAAGQATVSITGGKILANDGLGTDVYTGQSAASFTINAATASPIPASTDVPARPTPVVSSSTHPEQSSWYQSAEAKLSWAQPTGVQGVSYALTSDPTTTPDEVFESGSSTTVTLSVEGVWYFHLRAKYESGWSATRHFVLQFDRTPPESFTPAIAQDRGPTDPSPELTFSTIDRLSGVAKYTYSIDGGPSLEVASPADLTTIAAGTHIIVVTAHDQAGNIHEGKVGFKIEGYSAPIITYVSTPMLLLDSLVVRGTAKIGDTIILYANNQIIGQTIVGAGTALAAPGVTLVVPWSFTTDKLFRPGTFDVTATATSTDGQVSVATDPKKVRVNGQALILNGRPIATLSVVTPLVILVLVILALIAAVMTRLILAIILLHRHQDKAEDEIETLREVNRRQSISRPQLDRALEQIEEDLEGLAVKKPGTARRRIKKRPR